MKTQKRLHEVVGGALREIRRSHGRTYPSEVLGRRQRSRRALPRAERDPRDRFVEALGGALVGYPLGTLPDILEPATSPRHRDFFHSVAFAMVGGGCALPKIDARQQAIRAWCVEQQALAQSSKGLHSLWHTLLEFLGRLVAGAVPALFGVAYGSHLLLDSMTPAGLPLI